MTDATRSPRPHLSPARIDPPLNRFGHNNSAAREFARWKVRNTAIERRDLMRNPVPLMPEFQHSVRLLGRRPTTQQFIDTIIKKYGTHILISATLG
ncbi:hypothetical protein KUCAC02_009454, partial [Chaenocephalus aceratus]